MGFDVYRHTIHPGTRSRCLWTPAHIRTLSVNCNSTDTHYKTTENIVHQSCWASGHWHFWRSLNATRQKISADYPYPGKGQLITFSPSSNGQKTYYNLLSCKRNNVWSSREETITTCSQEETRFSGREPTKPEPGFTVHSFVVLVEARSVHY